MDVFRIQIAVKTEALTLQLFVSGYLKPSV